MAGVAAGRRISWWQVPDHVRRAVEGSLGAEVVEAQTQEGGFSPGAAARLRLSNGGTAFAKALGVEIHSDSVDLYRSEASAMSHLPAGLPVPRLIDVYDDGDWVALVFQEVRGRHPHLPWQRDELDRVVTALTDLGSALRPSPWPEAPGFAEANPELLGHWRKLAARPPAGLDPWLHAQLDRMAGANVDLGELVGGDALLHTDLRSDNLLLTLRGDVVFLDWAWTCRGSGWLDLVLFAMSVNAEGGTDADRLIRSHPVTGEVAPGTIDAILLAAGTAYWSSARLPEPPALRGIRAFQRSFADATLRWLRRRDSAFR